MLIEIKTHLADGCPSVEGFLSSEGLTFQFAPIEASPVYVVSSGITEAQIAFIKSLPNVLQTHSIATSYQLASRQWKKQGTVVKVGDLEIGGNYPVLIAGPCAVETEEQLYATASFLAKQGIRLLRGGAYKPRTSPYSFQGLKKEGLVLLRKVADDLDMLVVTELLDYSLLDEVAEYADILQIGTRNMHNFHFLKGLGKINKPVMLKRGFSATIEEWLLAAEHILLGGNNNVILCERGIRTFEPQMRNTLDLAGMALVKELSHLPIIVDPSQGTGVPSLIAPMSVAAVAAGADGLMVETHVHPEQALSDGQQSLNFVQFENLLQQLRKISHLNNKPFDFEHKALNLRPS